MFLLKKLIQPATHANYLVQSIFSLFVPLYIIFFIKEKLIYSQTNKYDMSVHESTQLNHKDQL
jgi:hypothetical protein